MTEKWQYVVGFQTLKLGNKTFVVMKIESKILARKKEDGKWMVGSDIILFYLFFTPPI